MHIFYIKFLSKWFVFNYLYFSGYFDIKIMYYYECNIIKIIQILYICKSFFFFLSTFKFWNKKYQCKGIKTYSAVSSYLSSNIEMLTHNNDFWLNIEYVL